MNQESHDHYQRLKEAEAKTDFGFVKNKVLEWCSTRWMENKKRFCSSVTVLIDISETADTGWEAEEKLVQRVWNWKEAREHILSLR